MELQLYLRVRGRVLGPYDQEKLQSLVRRGQLSRMHEVSADGVRWEAASTYADLFVAAPVKLAAPDEIEGGSPRASQAASDFGFVLADETASAAAGPAGSVPSRGWYYVSLGAEHGPVEESVVRQLLLTRQLDADALVWSEGMPQWLPASRIAGLAPAATSTSKSNDKLRASDDDIRRVCKIAAASRPWALFLAITAFVYAGLCILLGLLVLIRGASVGLPSLVAIGLFEMITGVVTVAGGILLINYANRLASLAYGSSCTILESALDRLKTFWMFASIVLIVILAFIGFFIVWLFAVGVTVDRFVR